MLVVIYLYYVSCVWYTIVILCDVFLIRKSCSILSYFILILKCITCASSLSLKDIKLNAIVNWIFHVWFFFFLRSYMKSFMCGFIFLRYSSTDSVLFLSSLLSYIIKLSLCNLSTFSGF